MDIGVVYNSMIHEWYMYIFESAWLFAEIFADVLCLFFTFYIYICTHLIQVFSVDLIPSSIKSLHLRAFVCFVVLLFFFSRDNQRKESSWKSEKEWKGNVSWHQPAVFNHWTNRRFSPPAVWGEYWHDGLPWFMNEKQVGDPSVYHQRTWQCSKRRSLSSPRFLKARSQDLNVPPVFGLEIFGDSNVFLNRWYSQLTWWLSNFNRKAVLQREAKTSTLPPIEAKFDVSRISIALLEFNCFPTVSIDVPSNWNKEHKPKNMVWLWTSM